LGKSRNKKSEPRYKTGGPGACPGGRRHSKRASRKTTSDHHVARGGDGVKGRGREKQIQKKGEGKAWIGSKGTKRTKNLTRENRPRRRAIFKLHVSGYQRTQNR